MVDLGSVDEHGIRRSNIIDSVIERDAEVGRLVGRRDCKVFDSQH